MTKANDKRVRMSLERTRLALKSERLELEKQRREWTSERALALPVLRLLCATYGSNDWPDELSFAEILEQHLARPLADQVAEINRYLARLPKAPAASPEATSSPQNAPPAPQQAPNTPSRHQQAPTPLRLTLVPAQEHRTMVVPAQLRGVQGFRATCICGWRSPLQVLESTTQILAEGHVGLAEQRRGRA